jgi:hypothetical protein
VTAGGQASATKTKSPAEEEGRTMKRTTVLVTAVLLLALTLPTVALGRQQGAAQQAGRSTLWGSQTTTGFAPDGSVPEIPVVGTRFLTTEVLYSDAARTVEVGSQRIECVKVREYEDAPFAGDLLCHGVLILDGRGHLAWQGPLTFSPDGGDPTAPVFTMAVTGGTGDFLAAGGEILGFDESTDEESLTRYELTVVPTRRGR